MAFSGRWKRYACCPLDQPDIPSPPQNLVIFEMQGYNYRAIPEWFDETGQKLVPIQFSVIYKELYYRWSFYRKAGELCKKIYHLSTSDDIVPSIYDVVTGKHMNVERVVRHNGYTSWRVSC